MEKRPIKLIIQLASIRDDLTGSAVEGLVNLFKSKIRKQLKRAKARLENSTLDYKIYEFKRGFKAIVTGSPEELQSEYDIIDQQYNSKKTGMDKGKAAFSVIGLSFLYWLEYR